METVIFACVHNAGRSQMAAAFFNELAAPESARAVSAGTRPAEHIHPVVVEAMREQAIDISANQPQRLTDALLLAASGMVESVRCSRTDIILNRLVPSCGGDLNAPPRLG
jgi:arsenate reductase (thioredoxin)